MDCAKNKAHNLILLCSDLSHTDDIHLDNRTLVTWEPEAWESCFFFCAGVSPFVSPRLSNPGFLALLCPMVKILELFDLQAFIEPEEFATICKLSNLEELAICGPEDSDSDDEVCPPSTMPVSLSGAQSHLPSPYLYICISL